MADPLLSVKDLHGWYGESHVLHGMNFEVRDGEVVALLGRNGAGKTHHARDQGMRANAKAPYVQGREMLRSNPIASPAAWLLHEERELSSLKLGKSAASTCGEAVGCLEKIYQLFPNCRALIQFGHELSAESSRCWRLPALAHRRQALLSRADRGPALSSQEIAIPRISRAV